MIVQLTEKERAAAASGPLREGNGVIPIDHEASAARSEAMRRSLHETVVATPQTEPPRLAMWVVDTSAHGMNRVRFGSPLGQQEVRWRLAPLFQRGKGRLFQGETTMKTQSKAKVGSTGKGSGESHHVDSSQKFELCRTEETPRRVNGLARVSFDLVPPTHPSITAEVEYQTSFAQFCQISGIPDPETLLRWLVADRVLFEFGGLVGLVPDVRYVQAGLFLCHVVSCQCCEDDAFVSVSITPKGVMWMLKHYVPTPERHRDGFIPEDLRGPID